MYEDNYNSNSVCASCGRWSATSPCALCAQGVEDHHIFPQQFAWNYFQPAELPYHDWTITLSRSEHDDIHRHDAHHQGWNQRWETWIENHQYAPPHEIQNFAAQMLQDYGLDDRLIHRYRGYGDE